MAFSRLTLRLGAVALILGFTSPASAVGSVRLASIGPAGGNGATDAGSYFKLSDDGRHVFFTTADSLTADDTDSAVDVYVRTGSTVERVSTGPIGGNGTPGANLQAISANGRPAFFTTTEALTPDDTDTRSDVYERRGSTTTRISTGPNGGNGDFDAYMSYVSKDGRRAFFSTAEPLTADDTDTWYDDYMRSGKTTTHITVEGPDLIPNDDVFLYAISPDGRHAFFVTREPLAPGDTGTGEDLYDWNNGDIRLISTGPNRANAPAGAGYARFIDASEDGSHVLFDSADALVASDTDHCYSGCVDTYERVGDTTTLVSTGPSDDNGDEYDTLGSAISADGARAFFRTRAQLVPEDQDRNLDVYERTGGTTLLVSTDPPAQGDSYYEGSSADGGRVFFSTSGGSIFERSGGQTTLVAVTNGPFAGNSEDGSRVFFRRAAQPGGSFQIFQRFDGQTTLVSTGPTDDGSGQTCQFFVSSFVCPFEVTPDGTTVAFWDSGRLVSQDTDNRYDVYLWHENRPPECGSVTANPSRLSQGKPRMRGVRLRHARDPDGDPVALEITGVTQDEPTDGSPDAVRTLAANRVLLRAERDRGGDGRVYRIAFTASDGEGGTCSGSVGVSVPAHGRAVDSAPPSYDSFAP
jgi:hypothetical protein